MHRNHGTRIGLVDPGGCLRGFECIRERDHDRVVLVLRANHEEIGERVALDLFGVDGIVGRGEARFERVVGVDHCGGDLGVVELTRELRTFDRDELQILRVVGDVRFGDYGQVGLGERHVHLDQPRGFEQVQRTRVVRRVARNGDRVAVGDLVERGDLVRVEADRLEVHVGDGDEVVDSVLLLPVHEVRLVLEEVGVDIAGGEQLVGVDLSGDLTNVERVVAERTAVHDLLEDLDVRCGGRGDHQGVLVTARGATGRQAQTEDNSCRCGGGAAQEHRFYLP